ncbi:hypothetical protein PV328_008381 [Microctonus aethiopoides]|uniref:Polyprenol reductase n=1 Tax=Microctonus aethiopoides TaxID=144406 RepID=A0AA39KQV0_9HYME|nr:hypothetical protein PV328_008381 [Microctonus aethiopoides]
MLSNFVEILFFFLTVSIMSSSLLVHTSEGYMSNIFKGLLYYGKYYEPSIHRIRGMYEVPKRWFFHFYLVAILVTNIAFILSVNRYFYNCDIPDVIHTFLNIQLGATRKPLGKYVSMF